MTPANQNRFINYSNETEDMTIESLMKRGFTAYEAEAYLSKLKIQKLFENDNDCKNEFYNPELNMPQDRMKNFNPKKKGI